MESTLLCGRYTSAEAEQLLNHLYDFKVNFHLEKASALASSEEDIQNSLNRINELEAEVKRIVTMFKVGKYSHVALNAKIVLEFCPDFQNG